MTGRGRVVRDLAFGARLAFAGGRSGWVRLAMTAVGVGLGVALLLVAASVPAMAAARDDRQAAREDIVVYSSPGEALMAAEPPGPADNTLVVMLVDTTFRDAAIRGRLLRPDGANPPLPPGVSVLPGPGEMVVSPALARVLASPDGELLQPRLDYRIVGTISKAGLAGPNELAYYAGTDLLDGEQGHRIDRFGGAIDRLRLGPMLILLVVVGCVVLLVPIAVFVGAAMRFGGEHRDRRMAALRLVGADARMARRIAAGETMAASMLGLATGAVFFLLGRHLVEGVTLWGLSAFGTDLAPNPVLATLIGLAVPAVALAVTVLALRRVVIEPLGVVRQATGERRRVWWRLALPAAGAALLYPLVAGTSMSGAGIDQYRLAAGVVLLLVGVAALLPWLIEAIVRGLRGGPVPWQLAIRRLQLSSGTSARVVTGVAVAVAGAIALQMLFTSVEAAYTYSTGEDPQRAQAKVTFPDGSSGDMADFAARLREATGVVSVSIYAEKSVHTGPRPDDRQPLLVADCPGLSEVAVLDDCRDGDVFAAPDPAIPDWKVPGNPGEPLRIGLPTGPGTDPQWVTIPAPRAVVTQRPDPQGIIHGGILATPGALNAATLSPVAIGSFVTLDLAEPDAIEHVRNAAASLDVGSYVNYLEGVRQDRQFVTIRRGLLIGAVATLVLIGASLLLTTVEQVHERRRLLAVLVAFGTRRRTLGLSVLWQTAVPIALGLGLAVLAGIGLGALLLAISSQPFRVDWSSVAALVGVSAGVVLLVTMLSLPALWRMMRPDGLRSE